MTNQKKILIIDDDPDYVEGIRTVLEKAEYFVSVAHNPKEGLRFLQNNHVDLLLLDIMMGRGAEGVAVARKIRKDPSLKGIPIIIITGIREQMAFLFPGQPVRPNFAEFDELVEKPIEPSVLLEKVNSLLQQPIEEKKV